MPTIPRALTNGLWAAGATLSVLILRKIHRSHARNRALLENPVPLDDRPVLMFSGAASLFSYYGGVQYYLFHHFDLTSVRCTGISMGCTVAQAITLRMTPSQMFEVTLEWAAMIWNRPLKCFLMTWWTWVEVGLNCCDKFGITDERVLDHMGKGTAYVGVTDMSVFPPECVALTDAISLEESLYWTTLSMRIFPFFRYPGWFRNMFVVDGFFSAIWCTPPNVSDPDRLIRVSPFPLPQADICPKLGEGESFSPLDVMYSRTKEQMWHQMKVGYSSCARAHAELVRKGLKEKSEGSRLMSVDEFGVPGTMEHMLMERESTMMRFKEEDPRKTKWRVQSFKDLKSLN